MCMIVGKKKSSFRDGMLLSKLAKMIKELGCRGTKTVWNREDVVVVAVVIL